MPDNPCDAITGQARQLCEGEPAPAAPDAAESLDPLATFAREVARAAAWTSRRLGEVIGDPAAVDVTNAGFLQQYALVFAASTVLVLLLWLTAVAKRALHGAPLGTALGEAIGLLWLAVGATAFTPLILYVTLAATSGLTNALVSAMGSQPGGLFESLAVDLEEGAVGGGPLVLAVVAAAVMLLCGALWLLLVIRALGLYVGAILGVVVYSALVDRDWWGHVRRWAGFMVALILAEPVIVIVIGLASALQTSDSTVVTGLGITVIALGVAVLLITKVPGWGDAVKVARLTARTAGGAARAVTGSTSASAGVMRGIHAHGGRDRSPDTGSSRASSGGGSGQSAVSGGISAHGHRTPQPRGNKNSKGD